MRALDKPVTRTQDEQTVFFLTSHHLCVFHTNMLAIKYLLMCQNPYGRYANENNGKRM